MVGTVEGVLQDQDSVLVQKIIGLFEHGDQALISKCQMNPLGSPHDQNSVVVFASLDIHKIFVVDAEVVWEATLEGGSFWKDLDLGYCLREFIIVLLVLLLKV